MIHTIDAQCGFSRQAINVSIHVHTNMKFGSNIDRTVDAANLSIYILFVRQAHGCKINRRLIIVTTVDTTAI